MNYVRTELKIICYVQKPVTTSHKIFRARYEKQSVNDIKGNNHYLQRET
jgi:hypothetical protein